MRILSDSKIVGLNKGALKKGWSSHTHPYRNDVPYRALCLANGTAGILYWADGAPVQPSGVDMRTT